MPKQSSGPKQHEKTAASLDQLEVTHSIEPPPIDETLEKVTAALAVKPNTHKRHQCRECKDPNCRHFQRIDLDTQEHFDATGPEYVDADSQGRR